MTSAMTKRTEQTVVNGLKQYIEIVNNADQLQAEVNL